MKVDERPLFYFHISAHHDSARVVRADGGLRTPGVGGKIQTEVPCGLSANKGPCTPVPPVQFTRLHHEFDAASKHRFFQLGFVQCRLMDMLLTLPNGRKCPSRHEAHPPESGVVCARQTGYLTCVIACFGSKLDTRVCTIPCVKSDGCILAYGSSQILGF